MVTRVPLAPAAACSRLQLDVADRRAIPRLQRLQMLALMQLIRCFEERLLELKEEDLVHGPVHASVGQEAVAAGVAAALRTSDLITSTHRAHGHFIAKAVLHYGGAHWDPLASPAPPAISEAVYRTLAEIMGLEAGWCGGRGGSMHLYDRASGNLGSNAIVGGGIPLATGAAWAERLRGGDRVVVAFFGDGAINQGCFAEVANMAALWGLPVLYLVENNGYAVGTSTAAASAVPDLAQRGTAWGIPGTLVDGMDPLAVYTAVEEAAGEMRAHPAPRLIEARTYRYYHHGGGLPGSALGYRTREEEAAWRCRDPLPALAAEVAAQGELDASGSAELSRWAQEVVDAATARCTEPVEGRRVIPAAYWPEPHAVDEHLRTPDPALRRVPLGETRPMSMVRAIAAVTRRAMERDERVIVLGEEVANLRGGAYGATRGLAEAFPERVINTPISETGFLGMAGGAAALGMRPIVEVMFPDFALMASDQLFNQIGKLRHMYGGQVSFPLVVRTRLALGYGYGGQHSMDPAGYFAMFPGWRVLAPSNAADYVGLMNTALACEGPVLLMEHGMLYDQSGPVPTDLDYQVPYGSAQVVRQGSQLTVLTYLTGVQACLERAEAWAQEGIEIEVIDLRTLDYLGMDYATIGASLARTGAALIVEQAGRSQGIGARLADEIQSRWFDLLDAPVAHLAARDVPPPVSRVLEAAVLPDGDRIHEAMGRAARRQVR